VSASFAIISAHCACECVCVAAMVVVVVAVAREAEKKTCLETVAFFVARLLYTYVYVVV